VGGTRQLRRQIELAIQSSRKPHTFLDRDCTAAKIAADSCPRHEPHGTLRDHVSLESSGDGHTIGFDGVAFDVGAGCHREVAHDDDVAFDVSLDDEGSIAVDATADASAASDAPLRLWVRVCAMMATQASTGVEACHQLVTRSLD
jgi:hypothetical protein